MEWNALGDTWHRNGTPHFPQSRLSVYKVVVHLPHTLKEDLPGVTLRRLSGEPQALGMNNHGLVQSLSPYCGFWSLPVHQMICRAGKVRLKDL